MESYSIAIVCIDDCRAPRSDPTVSRYRTPASAPRHQALASLQASGARTGYLVPERPRETQTRASRRRGRGRQHRWIAHRVSEPEPTPHRSRSKTPRRPQRDRSVRGFAFAPRFRVESKEHLRSQFAGLEPIHIGHYDVNLRDDSGFHYVFIGRPTHSEMTSTQRNAAG